MNHASRSVLVVTSEFPPMPGGIGNHAYNLCKQLAKHGYSVTVLTNKRLENPLQFDTFIKENPDIDIKAIDRSFTPVFSYFKRLSVYRQLLRQHPSHIIFSGKFSIWLAGIGWHKSKAWGVIHGSEIKQSGIKKWIFERGLNRLDGIISVSKFTEDFLLNYFPLLATDKCHVINNGFELDQFPIIERIIEPNECRIITVGGMHRRKGQHNIIAALPTLIKRFSNVHYTMAGLPESMSALQQQAIELGVTDFVTFVPNPNRADLVRLLQQNHVFAMLSENLPNGDIEGFGIAILEGMSLGLPAIGSRNSGIRDAIPHKQAGILIEDIYSANEISSALDSIMRDYGNYSNYARQWSGRFRWTSVIGKYLQLMEAK